MTKRWWLLLVLICGLSRAAFAAEQAAAHSAAGLVLKVEAARRMVSVSCEEIPGYMSAMEMEFSVRDAKALGGLRAGEKIRFRIVPRGKALYAEGIAAAPTASFESEPMEAGTLSTLNALVSSEKTKEVAVGQVAPDFALTDQVGKRVRLSDFKGKVVALTFGYSRCPNPNYCYRLSHNLERVEKRFHGRDLVLMTIAIDPAHDQGETLREYAGTFHADAADWHFLTGSVEEVRGVAGDFGMNFWSSEGLLTHTLHTVILDREGRVAVNLEGNGFTPKELGDLVGAVLDRE